MRNSSAKRTKGGRGTNDAGLQASDASATGHVQSPTDELAAVVTALRTLGKARQKKFSHFSDVCERHSIDGTPCIGSGIISRGSPGFMVNNRAVCVMCGKDLAGRTLQV
jgi:hypothetical protein